MLSSDELEQIRAHVEDQRKWKIHGEWLPGCTGASNIQWPPGDIDANIQAKIVVDAATRSNGPSPARQPSGDAE